MRALDRINLAVFTYGRLLVSLFNVRLWPPFLLYAVVLILLLLMLRNPFLPLLSGWFTPIILWVSSDGALHYPTHLAFLPYLFDRFNLVPSLLLEYLLIGTVVLMFAARYRGDKPSFPAAFREAIRHYWKFIVIWLISFVPVYLVSTYLPPLFADVVRASPRREMLLLVGIFTFGTLLYSLFIYVVPYLLLKRKSLLGSFAAGIRTFFSNFFTTAFLVAIPQFILILPFVLVMRNPQRIVDRFTPDLIFYLLLAYIICLILAIYFIYGSIVRFFVEVSED